MEIPGDSKMATSVKEDDDKITGYRKLNEDEIELINEIKGAGEDLYELITALKENENIDKNWVDIGATDLQKGLMALVRSVAKPTTF